MERDQIAITLSVFCRDLALAVRALTKARVFTFVGLNTEELVQLVTRSVGPHRQTEQRSYPDYLGLRDANTGITLFGWTGGQSEITFQPSAATTMQASTMFVPANYFRTLGVALARGAGFDASVDDHLRAPRESRSCAAAVSRWMTAPALSS